MPHALAVYQLVGLAGTGTALAEGHGRVVVMRRGHMIALGHGGVIATARPTAPAAREGGLRSEDDGEDRDNFQLGHDELLWVRDRRFALDRSRCRTFGHLLAS